MCDEVVEVRRVDGGLMVAVLMHGTQLLHVVSAYVPQAGRSDVEKNIFYEKFAKESKRVGPHEFVVAAGDFNGHVGAHPDGFEGVHWRFGIGARNGGGRRLLEYCEETSIVVINT